MELQLAEQQLDLSDFDGRTLERAGDQRPCQRIGCRHGKWGDWTGKLDFMLKN